MSIIQCDGKAYTPKEFTDALVSGEIKDNTSYHVYTDEEIEALKQEALNDLECVKEELEEADAGNYEEELDGY